MKRERLWFVSFIAVFILGIFAGISLVGCGIEEKSAQGNNSPKTLQEEKSVKDIYNKGSIAPSNLTHADFVGSFKVSWGVASSKEDYIVPFLTNVLQDDNEWSRAGVRFEYSAEVKSDFHIVFQTYTPEVYSSPVDPTNPCYYSNLAGCAGVTLTDEGLQCTVSMVDRLFIRSSPPDIFFNAIRPRIINHEAGHCFGLIHSANMDEVMFPIADFASPTPNLREIEMLAGMLKSGEVYTAIENLHGISIRKK